MTGERPARLVVAAGVAAALHVGKLPPALPVLQEALRIDLVQAGFLLSMVQVAGMALGLVVGLAADSLGLRRTMVTGLLLLAVCSIAGAEARSASALLALRAAEGFGFLLASLPAPALIRRLVAGPALARALGWWGAYMPVGTALALLTTPFAIEAVGWPGWWRVLGALAAAFALAIALGISPALDRRGERKPAGASGGRVARTLRAAGPWWAAGAFAFYSAQWLAVIGFLPTLYRQAGWSVTTAALATTVAAGANAVGNVLAGRWLGRGWTAPAALWTGFAAMAVGACIAYGSMAKDWGTLETAGRFAGVLLFSALGGLVPGTLFSVAVRVAPDEGTVATTVGWMQQLSALGQFAGPPLVAWVAARAGWSSAWLVTGGFALAGVAMTACLARSLGRNAAGSPTARP